MPPRPCRIALAAPFLALAASCGSGGEPAEPPIAESEHTVAATDFATLELGRAVETLAGPEIDTSLATIADAALANLSARVLCPARIEGNCTPAELPPTTIYTYVYEVRPGFDDPNSQGFPNPPRVVPVERGESFALGFPASGFTGVAGYTVSEADSALEPGFNAVIACEQGRLVWTIPDTAAWSTGETITFFWQSTQPPAAETGEYIFIADGTEARARGPMPQSGGELPAVCG